jgi:hypothetical protein
VLDGLHRPATRRIAEWQEAHERQAGRSLRHRAGQAETGCRRAGRDRHDSRLAGSALGRRPGQNIAAPTDDRPFFFHMLRLRDVFDTARWRDQGIVQFNMTAVGRLGILLVTAIVLTALFIVLPLALSSGTAGFGGAARHILFFASIGLGFMLIERSVRL